MMLADDPARTLIEPIGRCKDRLPCLYDGELMLGGGRLAGWAVEDPDLLAGIDAALRALGDPEAFAARWPQAAGQSPLVLAVGDGNHSLATAKACWEELKPTLAPAERACHPARYCLAEVCNVQSPAIEIEPIHRVVFGAALPELTDRLLNWAAANGITPGAQGPQRLTLAGGGQERTLALAGRLEPLAVGTLERFLSDILPENPHWTVDYIHGADAAKALAADPARPATAVLLPPFAKADLFRGVVLGGVLPRKTFSMGHAEEKRYYNECRSLL